MGKDCHCLQRIISKKCSAWDFFLFTPFPVPILFVSMFFVMVNLNLDRQIPLDSSRVENLGLRFPLVDF